MTETVWIITEEFNQYDQYGEYFVCAFKTKPTVEELVGAGFDLSEAEFLQSTGGGRIGTEDSWYSLREIPFGERLLDGITK